MKLLRCLCITGLCVLAFVSQAASTNTQWFLNYSTYLGGDGSGEGVYGYAIAADSANNAIVAGFTSSLSYPVTHRFGAEGITSGAFITKFSATDHRILFSIFLVGAVVQGMTLDSQDNLYITGDSGEMLPATNACQPVYSGGGDAFAAKLSPDGASLLYCTFLGGSGMDMGRSIAVDTQGQAWVTGWTASTNFPLSTNAMQTTLGGKYDAFVVKLSSTGQKLLYASYLGGTDADGASSIAVDQTGNAYVGGWTRSASFPGTQTMPRILGPGGWQNGFVAKLNPTGTNLEYLAFLGGSDRESLVAAIAVDALGQAYLFGQTDATNFPVSAKCWQAQNNGSFDSFVAKLNRQGSALLYSTYLGGEGSDFTSLLEYLGDDRISLGKAGLAIDSAGNAYVAARTGSTAFAPTGFAANIYSGYYDGFAAKINADGSSLEHFIYLGNSNWDAAYGLALDKLGGVLLTGSISPGPIPPYLPITADAMVIKNGGNFSDSFLMRLTEVQGPPPNDPFANRIPLAGPRATAFGGNSSASKETGEPAHAGNSGGKSLWWTWKAPADGRLTVSTAGSTFDTLLAVYTNSALNSLKLAAANDDAFEWDKTSQVQIPVRNGGEYQVAVDGRNGESGQVLLTLTLSVPSNDDFANRITLTNFPAAASGSNVDASFEPDDPGQGRNVWWQWVAPISGSVSITTEGSSFDTDIAVYTNSTLTELGFVGWNDNAGEGKLTSQLNVQAVAGMAYQISVGGGYYLSAGTISLKIVPGAPPANDNFTNSILLTGSITNFTANNYAASRELGEPELGGPDFSYEPGYHTVWWSWQAPDNGRVTIGAASGDFDARIGIFSGTVLTNLTLVASNENSSTPHANAFDSQVNFAVRSKALYHIMVEGNAYHPEGNIQFHLHFYHDFSIVNQSLMRPTGAGFPLQGIGYPGSVYGVEVSTNLLDWEAIPSLDLIGPSFAWRDTNALAYPRRFYRWVEKKP